MSGSVVNSSEIDTLLPSVGILDLSDGPAADNAPLYEQRYSLLSLMLQKHYERTL